MQVFDGDREYQVEGRTAVIVRWIAQRADEINMMERIKLEIHCAGRKIRANQTIVDGEELMVR